MLNDLLKHNRLWSQERQRDDPDYFHRLAAIQRPDYLWIGCSDSRVPANVITGLQPGEVFVHRNVANLVHRGDLNLLSVLEFAVDSLQIRDIILCGHYGCGGISAALDGHRHGIVDHWLQPIRDVADSHAGQLADIEDQSARMNKLCELSIRSQVENLARTPIIEYAWQQGRQISIHGWVYSLDDGLIQDLGCTRSAQTRNSSVSDADNPS
jgi:carbonic anhydrase